MSNRFYRWKIFKCLVLRCCLKRSPDGCQVLQETPDLHFFGNQSFNPNSKNQNPKVEFEFLIVDFVHGLDFDCSCHRSDLNYDLTLVAGCSTRCYFWREDLWCEAASETRQTLELESGREPKCWTADSGSIRIDWAFNSNLWGLREFDTWPEEGWRTAVCWGEDFQVFQLDSFGHPRKNNQPRTAFLSRPWQGCFSATTSCSLSEVTERAKSARSLQMNPLTIQKFEINFLLFCHSGFGQSDSFFWCVQGGCERTWWCVWPLPCSIRWRMAVRQGSFFWKMSDVRHDNFKLVSFRQVCLKGGHHLWLGCATQRWWRSVSHQFFFSLTQTVSTLFFCRGRGSLMSAYSVAWVALTLGSPGLRDMLRLDCFLFRRDVELKTVSYRQEQLSIERWKCFFEFSAQRDIVGTMLAGFKRKFNTFLKSFAFSSSVFEQSSDRQAAWWTSLSKLSERLESIRFGRGLSWMCITFVFMLVIA